MKVLVIDDDPVSRTTVASLCERLGYSSLVSSGQDGVVDRIEQEQIDLVICDWELEHTTGLDVCAAIRNRWPDRFVYFILMSAHSAERYILSALMAGTDEFIHKPLDQGELSVRLLVARRIIQLQHKLQTLRAEVPKALRESSRDLRAMASLQASQLPDRSVRYPGVEFDYFWMPKLYVSGDHLNLMQLDEHTTAFYMLDVVGHGVPAALRALALSRVLSTHPYEGVLIDRCKTSGAARVRRPHEVLNILNARYPMQEGSEVYFTVVYGLIDARAATVTFSTAGSPYPMVQHPSGSLELVGQASFPIGIVDDPGFEDVTVPLQVGTRLFFYTDGLTELRDQQGQQLGQEQLAKLLQDSAALALPSQLAMSRQHLVNWANGKPADRVFEDDASLLAIQWHGLIEQSQTDDSPSLAKRLLAQFGAHAHQTPEMTEPFQFARRKDNSRVLLFTDRPDVDWLTGNLKEWGYQVDLVHESEQAADALRQRYYTFLLLDLASMPRDLEAFLWNARGQGANRSLFALMLTRPENHHQMMRALLAGVDNCTLVAYSAREIYIRLANGLRIADYHKRMINKNNILKSLRHDIEQDMQQITHMQLSNLPDPQLSYGHVQSRWLFDGHGQPSRHYMNIVDLGRDQIAFFHLSASGSGLVGATRGWALHRQLTAAAYDQRNKMGHEHRLLRPVNVLSELNALVLVEQIRDLEFAMVYGTLNTQTGEGSLALAGYPLSCIARANGCSEPLGAYGPAVGLSAESEFREVGFVLNAGDRLYLVPPDLFDQDVANHLFEQHADQDLESAVHGIGLALNERTGGVEVSLLALQFGQYQPVRETALDANTLPQVSALCQALPEPFQLRYSAGCHFEVPMVLSAVSDLVENVDHCLARFEVSEEQRHAARLALFEVCTNVTRHSQSDVNQPFKVQVLQTEGEQFAVLVQDHGVMCPSTEQLSAAHEFDFVFDAEDDDSVPEGGLGLAIACQLSQGFESRRVGDSNITAMLFAKE